MLSPCAKLLWDKRPHFLLLTFELLLLRLTPIGQVIMSLLVEHLGFFFIRLKVQSPAFSTSLRTTNIPVLLLKFANSLLESLDSGLS